MRRGCRERFPRHRLQRKPLVSDPGMHYDTQVSWCMLGSLTRDGGENVPCIPGACATRNSTSLARGSYCSVPYVHISRWGQFSIVCCSLNYTAQNMSSKSDCISMTCSRLRHFVDTFPEWNSCCSFKQLKFGYLIKETYVVIECTSSSPLFNLLRPSDAIRQQGTESTLAQVMACCLTGPSHYLNQCWLIISKVLWHSSEGIIMRRSEDTNQ